MLSIYTCVKNGLFYDYHVVDMLKHHLPLADEIVVNDGFSTDGTYEQISKLDPKIKVFQSDWGQPTSFQWFRGFKNEARRRCTGQWCINLDSDEFIPEWEFEKLRAHLEQCTDTIVRTRFLNFYGNYKVYHRDPAKVRWPDVKTNIHRNLPNVEVSGDGSNVVTTGQTALPSQTEPEFSCHHFGFVRNPARLRQKWRNIFGNMYAAEYNAKKKKWFSLPSFLFNLFPHDWKDPQFVNDLALYEGPFVRAVRENPDEFVRDRFTLVQYLQRRSAAEQAVTAS
jgi:glycosyltransferase involved in cell wall biosynthesis